MANAHQTGPSRLLRQMGVDVWVLRRPGGEEAASSTDDAPSADDGASTDDAATAARSDGPSVEPLRDARIALSSAAGGRTEPQPEAASGERARRAATADRVGVAPFQVLCLSKAGALLLTETGEGRSVRRFAADLLAAATGVWGGQTRQLLFGWPQPGVENSVSALRRALGAFVAKQLSDHPDGVCLVTAEVAERLGRERLPDDCLVLPPIAELMTRADLKRRVWEDIGKRLTP